LLQLRKAIGEPPLHAIHYDVSKGLIRAVKDVFPRAEMVECFRYLMQNYIKNFIGQERMYPTTSVYKTKVYEHNKGNVVAIDGLAH
jgi:hypothetical protein